MPSSDRSGQRLTEKRGERVSLTTLNQQVPSGWEWRDSWRDGWKMHIGPKHHGGWFDEKSFPSAPYIVNLLMDPTEKMTPDSEEWKNRRPEVRRPEGMGADGGHAAPRSAHAKPTVVSACSASHWRFDSRPTTATTGAPIAFRMASPLRPTPPAADRRSTSRPRSTAPSRTRP